MKLTNIKIRGIEARDKVWRVAWNCLANATGKYDIGPWEPFEEKLITPVSIERSVWIPVYLSIRNSHSKNEQ
jgi:hypothetical protein